MDLLQVREKPRDTERFALARLALVQQATIYRRLVPRTLLHLACNCHLQKPKGTKKFILSKREEKTLNILKKYKAMHENLEAPYYEADPKWRSVAFVNFTRALQDVHHCLHYLRVIRRCSRTMLPKQHSCRTLASQVS